MIILLYSDVFVVLKRPINSKPLNKINLDILVTDDLGCLQGFYGLLSGSSDARQERL